MYFHPSILTEAQRQQSLAAFQDVARFWLDGIDRQLRLHTDAVSELCVSVLQNLEILSEATDIAYFGVRWSACAVPVSLSILQLSSEPGVVAADVQCRVAALADRRTKDHLGSALKRGIEGGTLAKLRRKPASRQMVA